MGCNYWSIQVREIKSIDGSKPTVVAMVTIHNKIVSDFQAESSRYAKIGAAKKALALLEGLPLMEFREKYECECKPVEEEDEEAKKELDDMHGTAI